MFCSSLPGFNDDGSHEQKIQQPESARSIGYQRAFSCCPSALACPESRHAAKAHHRYRASGPTLSRSAMAQLLGTTPTNHQPLVCCSLAHSPSLPAGSHWRSAVSLDAPPRLPDSSDTQPAPKPPRSSVLLCFPINSDRIRPCGFEPSGLRSVELF